jgi:hypothetical protein
LESADLSLRFVARHLRPFARLTCLVALPGLAFSLTLRYVLGFDWPTIWVLSIPLAIFAEGPFTVLTGHLALSDDARVGPALKAFARRAPMYALACVLVAAFQSLAALLFVVPWFFAAMVSAFMPEVVLLEGANFRAFRRMGRVVYGYNGVAIGMVLLQLIGRFAAVAMTDAALRRTLGVVLDVRVHVESLWLDGGSPYALAGLWLSVPICAVFRYMAYIDLRTRREGWDLQRRFQVLSHVLAAEADA